MHAQQLLCRPSCDPCLFLHRAGKYTECVDKDEEIVFLHCVSTKFIHFHATYHIVFCLRSSELILRDLTVTGRRGGLGTRLQFERMHVVHTDQRLHSSLMHDGFAMELTNRHLDKKTL